MKTCPLCQSVSFDDMEVCYGCLSHLEPKTATVELPKPTSTAADNESVSSVIIPTITEPEAAIQPIQVSEAITYPPKSSSSFSGMARLHVQMP
ncbi:MAG: hypothetical protein LBG68_02885, partial [Coriobacteriales bacterium]|nr:hypothetical protein [Coriobacteriales bacterium]